MIPNENKTIPEYKGYFSSARYIVSIENPPEYLIYTIFATLFTVCLALCIASFPLNNIKLFMGAGIVGYTSALGFVVTALIFAIRLRAYEKYSIQINKGPDTNMDE